MAAKTTIAVLDIYHKDAISLLQSSPEFDIILPDDPRRQQWHKLADGVLVRSETRLTAEDFRLATPRLQVVVKQGVGVDNIDLSAAKANHVAVHNTPALNSETVAELSLALGFSLSRRVAEIDRRIRNGEKVVRSQSLSLSLYKKTVGIIGMGNIGRIAAQKWIGACGARIVTFDPAAPNPHDAWFVIPHQRMESLDQLLQQSDVVTLHVPLIPTTRGLIGARELGMMRDNSILINTSRGGIVDEAALLQELRRGRIWGAALDAVEKEPPTLDDYRELLELDNVIITPHVGASTRENQSESGKAAANIVMAVLRREQNVAGKLV